MRRVITEQACKLKYLENFSNKNGESILWMDLGGGVKHLHVCFKSWSAGFKHHVTTRRQNLEDHDFNTHGQENPKSLIYVHK